MALRFRGLCVWGKGGESGNRLKIMQSVFSAVRRVSVGLVFLRHSALCCKLTYSMFSGICRRLGTVKLSSFHMTSAHTTVVENVIMEDLGGSYVEDTTRD